MPLTRRQGVIVAVVAVICAATRFLAMARSVWDWDEALFTMGMRDYDVTLHHPHPPGFPVFIALAKIVRLVVSSDFRALQAVSLIAGLVVFPAVFVFARELGLRFSTCVIAGALFAFFPNVWFFGGGAFSDVPSIVLVLFSVTLLFRGARDRNAYWLGTLLLALAIGIRPQNLLVGLLPGLYATRKRRPAEVLVAAVIGVVVVGAAFAGAIQATGSFERYMRVVREHGEYIARVDSWRSAERPQLWRIFDRFFLKQYQSPVLSVIATIFVTVSLVGAIRERSRALFWNAMTFLPFAVFAWLTLDRFSISRFSIGYQPMFAIFVADGIHRFGVFVERKSLARRTEEDGPPPAAHHVAYAVGIALVAGFVAYTLPALGPVRRDVAPSILAAEAVLEHVHPPREQLFVGHTMSVFLDLVAPDFPYKRVIDDRAVPLGPLNKPSWLLAEITDTGEEGFVFKRQHGALWNIARRHYFEIKLHRVREQARFLAGWYAPEEMDIDEWRWMSGHSVTLLPPAKGRTLLRMHLGIPREVMPEGPRITIKLNGRVLGDFTTKEGYLERDYRVDPAPNGQVNVLELAIDQTVTPHDDGRALGLRVRYLGWGPS